VGEVTPSVRIIEANNPRRVMVALANPEHESDLLRLGRFLATGQEVGGRVIGIHLVNIPRQTPLNVARNRFAERPSIERTIAALAQQTYGDRQVTNGKRPLAQTDIEPLIDVAHDVFGTLISETSRLRADLLLMGWQGGFNVSQIYNSPVQRIISNATADVGVLKNRGLEKVDSILIPWGGGPHAQLGLEFAARIGQATGAEIHVLRVVSPNVDIKRERRMLGQSVEAIVGPYEHLHYHIEQDEDFTSRMLSFLDDGSPDLVIIGASHEWRIRSVLFGSIPVLVADYASCSVLMVRRHLLEH